MFNLGKELALCHAVAAQLISDDYTRHILKALQQPSKKSFGGFGIPPWLNEYVEYNAVLIHRTPKVMLHALDPDEHLIKVPLVTGPRTAAAQSAREGLAELLAPAPDGLVGDDNATLSQKPFDISQAEAEHVIQPDSVADDLGGKAMAIVWVGWRLHAASFASLQPTCQTQLP
jgi:hypothetical protein